MSMAPSPGGTQYDAAMPGMAGYGQNFNDTGAPGDGGMHPADAPPGTPFSADPNMGGAGNLSPDAQRAGYSYLPGPLGLGGRAQAPNGLGLASQGIARQTARLAAHAGQPTHDAGYSPQPSFQGGSWANPGPLAAGNMANRLPPQAQGPTTSFDQVMALRQGQQGAINPATGLPWGHG